MVAAAVIGAGVVGAGASIYGASTAANAQTSAAQQASATQMAMFNKAQANLAPYNSAGESALTRANAMGPFDFNPSMGDIQQTPGYRFNLQQGLKGVENSAAARGLGTSGAALKGAAIYATGLADSTYQNQFNNALTKYQTNYNNLLGQAQLGEAAGAGVASGALSTGAGVANNLIGAGNAQGAASIAMGNAIGSSASGIGNAYELNALLKGGLFGGGDPSLAEAGMYGLSQGMQMFPDGSIG